jgi:hypothetical protein
MKADLLAMDEDANHGIQSGFVNFIPMMRSTPRRTGGRGLWVVTPSSGRSRLAGYGMLAFGHAPEPVLRHES